MSENRETLLLKLVAKVLNYKRVNASELTTKRASQTLYNDLIKEGFVIKGTAETEWSFIKIFQVMFQDQNHMPDDFTADRQVVLDVLAFCYTENIAVLSPDDLTNYCEIAVLKGGEGVIYENQKRPKTLKISLFKIFSPQIYNTSSEEEIVGFILKAFSKIDYDFTTTSGVEGILRDVVQKMKQRLPQQADFKDHIEVVDSFLRILADYNVFVVKKK